MEPTPPSEQTRTALYAAVVRQASRVETADDLLTLTQAWQALTLEEVEPPADGEYVQTASATMLGQDPSVWWAEGRKRVGF
jgi:hypothetical protein